jgi:hypothetical protein
VADGDIADGDIGTIAVDAPAVFLDTIDALGVADIVIDIHHDDAVVCIDIYLVGVVGRCGEDIAVDSFHEALTL